MGMTGQGFIEEARKRCEGNSPLIANETEEIEDDEEEY